jgi:hypothetical protein
MLASAHDYINTTTLYAALLFAVQCAVPTAAHTQAKALRRAGGAVRGLLLLLLFNSLKLPLCTFLQLPPKTSGLVNRSSCSRWASVRHTFSSRFTSAKPGTVLPVLTSSVQSSVSVTVDSDTVVAVTDSASSAATRAL